MITPATWTLNFRGEEWLASEVEIWSKKVEMAYGTDRADASRYLEIVRAELKQRQEAYSGGTFSAALAGLAAPFEAFGGSGGAGAPGAAGTIYDSAAQTATGIADTARKYSYVIIGGLFILAGFALWIYLRKR